MHYNDLIATIKLRRESLRITQEMLSDLSEVSLRTIKQFESGKGNPTLQTLQKIVEVLGLEIQITVKNLQTINAES